MNSRMIQGSIVFFSLLARLAFGSEVGVLSLPSEDIVVGNLRNQFISAKVPTAEFIAENPNWNCRVFSALRGNYGVGYAAGLYRFVKVGHLYSGVGVITSGRRDAWRLTKDNFSNDFLYSPNSVDPAYTQYARYIDGSSPQLIIEEATSDEALRKVTEVAVSTGDLNVTAYIFCQKQ